MIKKRIKNVGIFNGIKTTEGETIEKKIERITQNKEPITDSSPMIYTEKKNGVEAAYDVRTDKWDIAQNAMDTVSKQRAAKKDGQTAEKTVEKDGKAESIQGTEGNLKTD